MNFSITCIDAMFSHQVINQLIDVGVITNVGPAHLEGLGTIDNVARAKGELLHTLRAGGTAILNWDDELVREMAGWTSEHGK